MRIKKGESYSDFIKRLRTRLKMTQAELALRMGVHANTISAWENGRPLPYFSQKIVDDFARKIK